MYDWNYGEKVFLTAWNPIVSYNETITYRCDTLQIYIIIYFSTIRSIWSLVTKENKGALTKKLSSCLADFGR